MAVDSLCIYGEGVLCMVVAGCLSSSTPLSLLPATRWKRTGPSCRRRSAASCWWPSFRMPATRQSQKGGRSHLLQQQKRGVLQLSISAVNCSIGSPECIGRKPSLIFLSQPRSLPVHHNPLTFSYLS